MNAATTQCSDKTGQWHCFLVFLSLLHEPSLGAIFLFPADTIEQSCKQFEDNQTAVCSKLSHGLFFKKCQPAVEIDGVTDHRRQDPQFWVTLRCILFHRTVLYTAALWLRSDIKADKSLQKQRPARRMPRGGHMQNSQPQRREGSGGSCSPCSLSPRTLTPGPALGAEAHRSRAFNNGSPSTGLQKIEACVNLAVFHPYWPFYWERNPYTTHPTHALIWPKTVLFWRGGTHNYYCLMQHNQVLYIL